ncbi:MAG: lamin tail domain-containing protein, partial [Verrucomicrobiae bacterium]|nr:lamin tail domain-containing protein [Verrucomicrobiae bacterium]
MGRQMRGTIVFLGWLLCGLLGSDARASLVLNEVMPLDLEVLADEDGDYPGWVELLNIGRSEVNLRGYGFSDDARQPFKWVFPSALLGPGKTLLVFTSGKDRRTVLPARSSTTTEIVYPHQISGLALWLDASEVNSVVLENGKVAVWRDRTGRLPPLQAVVPSSPEQFPGLCLWFDAADRGTITVTNGRVSSWQDKSGAGQHAIQEDATLRPVVTTNTDGGLTVVRFNGQGEHLTFPRLTNLHTIFWVGREAAEAPAGYRPIIGDAIAYDFHRGEDGRVYFQYGCVGAASEAARTWLNGELVIPTMVRLPLNMALVTTISGEPLAASTLSSDRFIEDRYWWGEIAEVIGFARELSEAERKSIEAYLIGKWRMRGPAEYRSYDAFQNAAGRRPEYRNEPLTGMPYVWFDGEDDGLEFPRLDRIRSVFWVMKPDRTVLSNYRP